MPIFEYRCQSCGTVYDVFHKTRELIEDIVCPSCASTDYKRLISATSVSMSGGSSSVTTESSCDAPGGCCGGACSIN